jgi:hypothetical protein
MIIFIRLTHWDCGTCTVVGDNLCVNHTHALEKSQSQGREGHLSHLSSKQQKNDRYIEIQFV